MDTQEKINYIEKHDYKVWIGKHFIRVTDPLDGKEGFSLTDLIENKEQILNETLEMINQ